MDEKREHKKLLLNIGGIVLLIAALVLGIKGIFLMLDQVMPKPAQVEEPAVIAMENGGKGVYALTKGTAGTLDYDRAGAWMEKCAAAESGFCWLSRSDASGRLILVYLPTQDRAVELEDMTTEYESSSGDLVLRIRTPEGAQTVRPEEQVLCLTAGAVSDSWSGRLRIILDGRELECAAQCLDNGGQLFWAG